MKKLKVIFIILISLVLCIQSNIAYAADKSIDDSIKNAQNFIEQGEKKLTGQDEEGPSIEPNKIKEILDFLYNLLLGIGMILAVLVGIVIGIKYMTGSVEEKADLKQALIGYVVSCVVIFGAFGIWKLVVNMLSSAL